MGRNDKGQFESNSDTKVKDEIEKKYAKFEYIGGYVGSDDYFYLMCKDCGYIFRYHADIIRPSRRKKVVCKHCQDVIRNIKEREIKEKQEERAKAIKQEKLINEEKKRIENERELSNHMCEECGIKFKAAFIGHKYCSKKCMNKYNDRVKKLRKRMRAKSNGRFDNDIGLGALIKRDKAKCHICNCKVDINDYTKDIDNNFIVGSNYPSIDHVKPISKGGTHTWDNIKLAHHYCNTIKNDNIVYEGKNNQLTLAM